MLKLMLVLLLAARLCEAAAADYSDCANNVITLENALYANGQNVLLLSRVFFPPGSDPPRFIEVVYQFLNETDELDGCRADYLWSDSTFLTFLPPNVFRWASLNFFYLENEFSNLTIVLPNECRPLVESKLTGQCTCDYEVLDDYLMMDHFTQQVLITHLQYGTYTTLG